MFHIKNDKICQTKNITPFYVSRKLSCIFEDENQIKKFQYNELENIILERICNKGFISEGKFTENIILKQNFFTSSIFDISNKELKLNFNCFAYELSSYYDCNLKFSKLLEWIQTIITNKRK